MVDFDPTDPVSVARALSRTRDDSQRATLLQDLGRRLPGSPLVPLIEDLFRHGDERERQVILRVLHHLPDPTRFVDLAVDACRTHIQTVFEAMATDNPFPARHFPEAAFNQMVVRALFLDVPLARILGLADRVTTDLRRMARAYAAERRAAGRVISDDLGRLCEGSVA